MLRSYWGILRLSMIITIVVATLASSFLLTYTWSTRRQERTSFGQEQSEHAFKAYYEVSRK